MLTNILSYYIHEIVHQTDYFVLLDNVYTFLLKVQQTPAMRFVLMTMSAKKWGEHATSVTGAPIDARTVC